MTGHFSALAERIRNRTASVGVVGIGYVGLPLAIGLAEAGLRVTGFDLDPDKVAAITRGDSYIQDVPSATLAAFVNAGRIDATTEMTRLADMDVINVCVPTPLSKTKDPDVSHVVGVATALRDALRPGQLIVLESTTYPGFTREMFLPVLAESGLEVGVDYFLAFSPERVDPGNVRWNMRNTPKIVGGTTRTCLEAARALYETFVERVIPVSGTDGAEMVKLLENTFRAVNIALVNEIALMCRKLGLDSWEVIEAASTKPFGFMPFYPGPGLGGHCIPVDPQYLSWKLKTLKYYARFVELAEAINSGVPESIAQMVADALNEEGKALKGSRVLVLGVAYKRDINDTRESPALDLIELLRIRHAQVSYHDPHVPEVATATGLLTSVDLESALPSADCVVVITDHAAIPWDAVAAQASCIVDTRNALRDHLVQGKRWKI